MKPELISVALVLALTGAGGALADTQEAGMSEDAYEAAKATIEAQFKADQKTCDRLKENAKDICDAQAEGKEKVEKARLEARYRPSPEATQEAKNAIADANYEVAQEKCDALKGKAGDKCMKEARAAREAGRRQARVEKVESTGGIFGTGAAGERKAGSKAAKP